jgi:hypothetical protein
MIYAIFLITGHGNSICTRAKQKKGGRNAPTSVHFCRLNSNTPPHN